MVCFEESIRVPLIISEEHCLPVSTHQSDNIALNIDVAPTILSFAGVQVSGSMQGRDLIKSTQKKATARKDFFYEHTFMGSPRLPKVEGVVTGDFKYMKYIEHGFEDFTIH
jgi:arylsulfatase A-like enzyme